MSTRRMGHRGVPAAARVFGRLDAGEALLPSEPSPARKTSALSLALLMLCAVPLFWAANAAGVIGDVPAAVAKGKNAGLADDDDRLGPRDGFDDDERTFLRTDQTSRDGKSTRGTTDDNDTRTKMGTDSTSRNGKSTRGTTKDNDTRTKMGTDNTSGNNKSTRGTTNDNDTYTVTGTDTGTRTGAASVTGNGGGTDT